MTPEQFEEIFEKVKNQHDSIQFLRNLVLKLGIEGKLIDHLETSASLESHVLELIKQKQTANSNKRAQTSRNALQDFRSDFEIPKNWTIKNLGDICSKITDGAHKTPNYKETGIPFVSIKDFSSGTLRFDECKYISPEEHDVLFDRCNPEKGDVILGRIGTLGKAIEITVDFEFSLFVSVGLLKPIKSCVDSSYLAYLINSPVISEQFDLIKVGGGTHTNKLNLTDLYNLIIPLPPLEEQKRIVAKVNELMALCDELEGSQKKTATIQKDFVASSLLKLQTDPARTFEELIEANLNYFSDKADLLHHTKNELVSLAIQGKFLKGGSTHPTFIPLGELCSKTGSGSTPRGGKSVYQDSGIALLRSQNIYNDGLRLNDVALISEATHEKMKGTKVYPGDLLLNITGGSIGRCCIVPDDTPEMNVSQHVSIVRLKDKDLAHFLHLVITSPYFQSHIMNEQTGAGREGLPKKKMDLIPIPIFGSSEQQEITEQAHKIVTLCDQLQAKIEKEESIKSDLLKTLVA